MTMFWSDWDWVGSEKQFRRAIELNPNDTNAHLFYAHLLSNTGRHQESLNEVKLARELDPLFPFAGALEGQFLFHAGKVDEALDRLQKTFELAPNFWMPHLFASMAYTEKGMYPEALAEARKARSLSTASTYSIAMESYALAKMGNRAEAERVLDEMLEMSKDAGMPATHIAIAYNGLGDSGKGARVARESLRRGMIRRWRFLKVDPKCNNLRSSPRFVELMKKMNF
jgi:serine/threonine-protein kinase